MVSITFVVMATQPSHKAQNETGKYQRGDIVDVHLTENVPESPHANSKFIFIDVVDVPLQVARKIKKIRDAEKNIVNNVQINTRRRSWYIDHSLIPIDTRQNLLKTRRDTATWGQIKNLIKRRSNEEKLNDRDIVE